ncbi:hypothetical protein ABZ915_47830 [Streptomyces sp. NPDC046915]|uniref:hypothetical protein n=1 Tax=Streptomyces sp. NPDC046915 TaxID=3155257 RepID=UPI0033ED97B0
MVRSETGSPCSACTRARKSAARRRAWAMQVPFLRVRDFQEHENGLLVDVRVSKVKPRKVKVPRGTRPSTCPVRAWQAWKEEAGLTDPDDFAYKPLHPRWHTVMDGGLDPETIGDVITKLGAAVELKFRPTGHSPRRGAATSSKKAIAFVPNGRSLYTASDDAVRQWDVRVRQRPVDWADLRGHTKSVDALAVSPDGRTLATGSEDWTARLWDTDPDRVARRVCRTTDPADLTAADWHRFLPGLAYQPPCPTGIRTR